MTKLALEFDEMVEKRTQFTLEMIGETRALYEQTNSPALHALLMDVDKAIEVADLTDIQRDSIRLYFYEGYGLEEIAEIRGVKWQPVQQSIKAAVRKIANVFRGWNYWAEGEEYVPRAH